VEVPVEETSAEDLAPVLEAVADADLTLVDQYGETLALASNEVAAALTSGDPYYKVGTTTYYFKFPGQCGSTPNCFEHPMPISDAISHISTTGLPSDGMIYIEEGLYTEQVYIDADITPIYSGLKGLIGTVVDGVPQVKLTGNIWIKGIDLGFTLKGFDITSVEDDPYAGIAIDNSVGTIKIEDVKVRNSGTGGGIVITNHNGSVILNRVEADGSASGGAYINNSTGATGVTITNSSFNNNGSDAVYYVGGLTIATKGAISLDGVTGIGNTGGWPGLFIYQGGTVSIKNSVFSNNASFGIYNGFSSYSGIQPTGNITLLNVIANNNDQSGIGLATKGNISLTGVTANQNGYRGADLETCYSSGVACLWLGTGAVTITNSEFNDNNSWNSLLVTARGAITLTNVSVSNSTGGAHPSGARLENRHSQLIAPVKVISGKFNDNDGANLLIYSRGVVTLSQVSASGSADSHGVFIDNTYGTTAGVTISGSSTSYNQFNENHLYGLGILSNGAISISYTQQNGNGMEGAYLDNTSGTGGVTISNSTFNDNTNTGLFVRTDGAIKATSVQASGNDVLGADLDNHTSLSTPGVTISGTSTAYNIFNDNLDDGLNILTKGAVSINYAKVDGNAGYGAYFNNMGGVGGVTVSNATFDDNTLTNLYVQSNGAIKATSIQANLSGNNGAELDNRTSGSSQGVTLANAVFWDNTEIGLFVASKGNIILTNTAGWDNNAGSGNGAYLNNAYGTGYVKITNPKSTDINMQHGFDNNSDGLVISTNGTATLTNVNAIGNFGFGIVITGITQKGATLTSCRVEGNASASYPDASIEINSMGPVVISGGYSKNNNKVGLEIDNTAALDTAPKPVTISNFNADGNAGNGIVVQSRGAITLTSVSANGSTGILTLAGINLDNSIQTAVVTLSKVKAIGNINDGIYINSKGTVKVSSSETSLNGNDGMLIYTQGMITLYNMIGNDNGDTGVTLGNYTSTSHAGVTITGTTGGNSFCGNGYSGLEIESMGAVTLNYITADRNNFTGIYIDNYRLGAGLGNVSVSYINTRSNNDHGLEIYSNGAVSLKSATSMLNGYHGASIRTFGHNLSVSSSVISGNTFSGILANIGSGTFTLTNTFYFGNDIDNTGDLNLVITH
ncbi:MAG: hypothetical protein HGA28_03090, partial [Anaerolineaceae bacterium]|nr:hypothetical protein [Anaerolineaceae bacterium]